MDLFTFVTLLLGFLAIIGTNLGLFLWGRSEARSDMRAYEANATAIIKSIEKDMKEFQNEMKFFHGRLCSLEARWHGEPLEREK